MTPTTAARVVGCEDDAGGLDGDVGAGADGDADVGSGECGCVVDAVADHGDAPSSGLERGDGGVFVGGLYLGEDLVDLQVACDGVGDLLGVAGDEHDLDATIVERLDRLAGFGADLVSDGDRAGDVTVDDDGEHGVAASRHWAVVEASPVGSSRPRCASSAGPPTATVRLSTVPVTPRPGRASKSVACGIVPTPCAALTMARAMGCSLFASTAAARRSTASGRSRRW